MNQEHRPCSIDELMVVTLARAFNNYVPGLIIRGPDTLHRFGPALLLSVVLTVALAATLAVRYRPRGWPWWLAAVITTLVYVLYASLGQTELWTAIIRAMARWSPLAVFALGTALGAVACWLGWRHGQERPPGLR
jgi:surface polysaccharide O-acyltransferase-like enzyme